jgi:F-type H+-transporting ATPase subunit epsilon
VAIRQDASTGKMIDDGQVIEQSQPEGNKIHAKVYSPFRTYYDDVARSLSAVSKTGPFDILPKHHNFISLLEPCEVKIVTQTGDKRIIKIAGGILHVHANRAVIMLDV